MKKSLFAVAAATAFAGAAQAQSSVTVYGVIDTGWVGGNQRVATTSAVNKGTWSQFQASGAESSNRLGFRGNEDLGGGNTAKFVIETSLNASNDTWNPTFRQAWAGLAKKGLGEARIGTQNSLVWQLAAPMTVGQLNNLVGSVINPNNFGTTSASAAGGADGNAGVGFTNRTQRTLQVESERISGFQGKAMYVLNNADSTATATAQGASTLGYTAGTNNQNGWGVSLDFTGVKNLRVAAAYQSFNGNNPYTATQAQINAGSGYTTNSPSPCAGNGFVSPSCVNVKDNQTYVAATYNFGILTAYANYINRQVTSQQTSNVYLKRSAQEIGVRGYATKTIEYWASAGNGRYSAFGANQPTANIVGYQVGSNYWMSKRTNLYAIYGQAGTSSTSSTGSTNVNNYALGVRHTF